MTTAGIEHEKLNELKQIRRELEDLTQAVYELRDAIVEGIKFLKENK